MAPDVDLVDTLSRAQLTAVGCARRPAEETALRAATANKPVSEAVGMKR